MEYMEQQMQNYIEAGIMDADRCYARIAELEELNQELAAQVDAFLECLCSIQQQCIGEIAMSYRLDAERIGQQIYQATGMTEPELRERLKTPQQHLAEIRAQAGRDGYVNGYEQGYQAGRVGASNRGRGESSEYADSIRQGEVK